MVTGCGGGNDDDDDDNNNNNNNDDAGPDLPPPATKVDATPAPGGADIPSNTSFTLKFDNGVDAATVNGSQLRDLVILGKQHLRYSRSRSKSECCLD